MEKKGTRLDKGNSFYSGETVYFVTKHMKEEILSPLFSSQSINCVAINIDTDQFGTFSGEIERKASVRETLRRKIQAGATTVKPGARLFLASEGSFGPDPFLPLMQRDLESLLLWDRQLEIEIYAEYLCHQPIHAEVRLGPRDDFNKFLTDIRFPDHGVMVHPENCRDPIFKGLTTQHAVAQAMLDCLIVSTTGRVVLATDLRANYNQTRREAIRQAGYNLIKKLNTLCPECGVPGFAITHGVPGLPCASCRQPTQSAVQVVLECVKCHYVEERPRPDGVTSLNPEECEFCNP